MKNAKSILLLFMFGGMFMLAVAETIQEFSDSSTTGEFRLGELGTIKNIVMEKDGFIKNATINLTGINSFSNFLDLKENAGESVNVGFIIVGQQFNSTKDFSLDTISMFLEGGGSSPEVIIRVKNDTSGTPIGSLIYANATLDTKNLTKGWINVSLNQSVTILSNKKYWVQAARVGGSGSYSWFKTDITYENGTCSGCGGGTVTLKLFKNVSQPTNLTISINGTRIYENLSNTPHNFNGSSIINLNSTLFNEKCESSFCVIGINFTSDTRGYLQYSNINITQNDIPNATNVSITPLPIIAENDLKLHCNYFDLDGDKTGGNQTLLYINNSIHNSNNNSFSLAGENVTEIANITFSCRVNDTYDWSDWVNSSIATVGDSTPPTITNISVQNISAFTTNDKINITAVVKDAIGTVQSVKVTTNKSGTHTNHTMNLIGADMYQFADTFAVGDYNIPFVYAKDGSNNERKETSSISFTVTSPSVPQPPSGGGGGGALLAVSNITNVTIFERVCNFNDICEGFRGEDFINCGDETAGIWNIGGDCSPQFAAVFCLGGSQCIWKFGVVSRIVTILMVISVIGLVVVASVPKKDFEKFKEKTKDIFKGARL